MAAIIVKLKILKIRKEYILLMSQDFLKQKIRFLAPKRRPLAREQTNFDDFIKRKKKKNGRHYRKTQNFENRKKNFLTHVPRSPQPKN